MTIKPEVEEALERGQLHVNAPTTHRANLAPEYRRIEGRLRVMMLVCRLHIGERLSIRESARVIGCDEGTVRYWLKKTKGLRVV